MGDRERERTEHALRRHYVEGRLDDTELSERLELVLQARSRRELRIALRQLPRWSDVEHLAERARHGALVAVVTVGALVAFPIVWIVLSALLYRRTVASRRRLHRP